MALYDPDDARPTQVPSATWNKVVYLDFPSSNTQLVPMLLVETSTPQRNQGHQEMDEH